MSYLIITVVGLVFWLDNTTPNEIGYKYLYDRHAYVNQDLQANQR
jgi:hypothetical protein